MNNISGERGGFELKLMSTSQMQIREMHLSYCKDRTLVLAVAGSHHRRGPRKVHSMSTQLISSHYTICTQWERTMTTAAWVVHTPGKLQRAYLPQMAKAPMH